MQYEPSAAELLAAIAELLDDELLPALPDDLKHRCRVAANLARILEREQRLRPEAAGRERARLAAVLDEPGLGEGSAADPPAPGAEDDIVELSRRLVARLAADDDPAFHRSAWEALAAIARDDLAISKPGHADWEGG